MEFRNVELLEQQLKEIHGEHRYDVDGYLESIKDYIYVQGFNTGRHSYDAVTYHNNNKRFHLIPFIIEQTHHEEWDEYNYIVTFLH